MRRFVYELVDRLHEPAAGLSRNRHTTLFSTPAGRRALHLFRHLRSLEVDLQRHGEGAKLSLSEQDHGLELRLEVPALRLVRTARLTPEDVQLVVRRGGLLGEWLSATREEGR